MMKVLKNSLNNSKNYIDKFKSKQNKEESSYSIKNSESSEEEDEKEEEKDEVDDKEDEKDSEDENEKKDDEKNELHNNIIKYGNNSIDNNIEILYKLNPRRNSLTYNIKNNNDNKNAYRASILSTKVNNQNPKYNYINNLSLEEKIKYRKRNNSTKIIDINTILNKEVLFQNKNEEILLYKLKNLNISLEKEKSYANYFKYLKDKDNPNNKNNNKVY